MRVLALDFDGVICDSAPETFVVAMRTYAELEPDSPLAARAARFESGALDREVAARDPIYGRYLDLLPLGNRAEDFGVALGAIDAGRDVADQEAYDALRAEREPAWIRSFHRRFYEIREEIATRDPRAWRALMRTWPAFLDVLRRRATDVELAIATAKDRRSVRALLEDYGIADLFPDDRLLDKEAGVSKRAHLEHLRRAFGVEFAEITFVDDKVNHLDDTTPLGVRGALATWGYNGAREIALARERGHLVCSLDDVEEQLFG